MSQVSNLVDKGLDAFNAPKAAFKDWAEKKFPTRIDAISQKEATKLVSQKDLENIAAYLATAESPSETTFENKDAQAGYAKVQELNKKGYAVLAQATQEDQLAIRILDEAGVKKAINLMDDTFQMDKKRKQLLQDMPIDQQAEVLTVATTFGERTAKLDTKLKENATELAANDATVKAASFVGNAGSFLTVAGGIIGGGAIALSGGGAILGGAALAIAAVSIGSAIGSVTEKYTQGLQEKVADKNLEAAVKDMKKSLDQQLVRPTGKAIERSDSRQSAEQKADANKEISGRSGQTDRVREAARNTYNRALQEAAAQAANQNTQQQAQPNAPATGTPATQADDNVVTNPLSKKEMKQVLESIKNTEIPATAKETADLSGAAVLFDISTDKANPYKNPAVAENVRNKQEKDIATLLAKLPESQGLSDAQTKAVAAELYDMVEPLKLQTKPAPAAEPEFNAEKIARGLIVDAAKEGVYDKMQLQKAFKAVLGENSDVANFTEQFVESKKGGLSPEQTQLVLKAVSDKITPDAESMKLATGELLLNKMDDPAYERINNKLENVAKAILEEEKAGYSSLPKDAITKKAVAEITEAYKAEMKEAQKGESFKLSDSEAGIIAKLVAEKQLARLVENMRGDGKDQIAEKVQLQQQKAEIAEKSI